MKRLHVHLSVTDLEESIRFYSTLFASNPAVRKADYAKWMLEDPQGVKWETFLTTGESTAYGNEEPSLPQSAACCEPSSSNASAPSRCCA